MYAILKGRSDTVLSLGKKIFSHEFHEKKRIGLVVSCNS